jgi:hypothetical protein
MQVTKTADYRWEITKDLISDKRDRVGVAGPWNAPEVIPNEWKVIKFRMLDDDGEIYYVGMLAGADPEGFEPLDDFGRPVSGCTEIQHFEPGNNGWVTL